MYWIHVCKTKRQLYHKQRKQTKPFKILKPLISFLQYQKRDSTKCPFQTLKINYTGVLLHPILFANWNKQMLFVPYLLVRVAMEIYMDSNLRSGINRHRLWVKHYTRQQLWLLSVQSHCLIQMTILQSM